MAPSLVTFIIRQIIPLLLHNFHNFLCQQHISLWSSSTQIAAFSS